MDLPSREALECLGEAEYRALAAMHGTVNGLHAEWQSALTLELRFMYAADAAEGSSREGGAALQLGYQIARELNRASFEFVQAVEVLLWRTASAYAVLGIIVLDRLVAGRPPLLEAVLEELCEEPMLGGLEAAVRIHPEAATQRGGSLRCLLGASAA